MEEEKMNLQEATLKALYDQLDDSKDIDDVEGLVDNVLVVTDPKINTEEYEELIDRAQEIVEDTPEGEIPFDEEWEGQYLQTCPICGATFVTDEILEPGAICPVCTQVPEAFVMVGRVETDEQVAKENNINTEENNEENNEIEGTEFTPETFEDEETEEPEEERIEASEEVKSADNKLQENKDSFPDTFINSVKKGGYKPLKYCREAGDNSFEEKMSAKEIMDIYNNLNNIYSNLYSKNMTDKADEEELFNDIQYWEDRLKKLHENKEIKEEAKSIDDFYTAFNWESFYNYIKDNLADHLFLSNVPNDNRYAFSVMIYDKSLENDFSNYSVAELKYDKQNKKIEIQFFEVIDDKIDYGQEIEITDIDEALDKINSYKYDYSIFKKESKNIAETEILDEEVEVLEEDRLNFKKYGIERLPEEDFSDDGNRFRCYICNGVPISYLYSDGRYYLSIRVDYLKGLTYDEYSKLPSYEDCDKYNMCDEVDLADVADICKRIKAEYDEALKNVKDVSDDDYKTYTDKYLEKAKKEFEEAKNSIRSLEPEDLLNASEWNIKEIKRDLENIKNEIDRWSWERKSKTDQTSRRRDLGYDSEENFKKVSYWLKDLKEVVNDIALKRTESLHENKETDIKEIMKIVNESKDINNVSQEFKDFVDEYINMYGDEVYEAEDASEVILNDYIQTTDAIDYNEAINKGYKEYIENIIDNNILTESDHDESRIANFEDLRDLRKASDALQDLWDTIEGGESEYLGQFKSDIADASDIIDKILQKAELSNMKTADILDSEIDTLVDELDESKMFESTDAEIDAFDKQLQEAGITTTNKLYYVTRTPEDCHTIEDADNWYRSEEGKKKWGLSYVRWEEDKGDITPEQYKLIDDNRGLAEDILIRACQFINDYGPLD